MLYKSQSTTEDLDGLLLGDIQLKVFHHSKQFHRTVRSMVRHVYDIETLFHVLRTLAQLTYFIWNKGGLKNTVCDRLPANGTALSL